ncbi:hypothetical protein AB0G06_43500 [Nonomuraea dietziae]|uniref:hypothetical protein n=1 Tax=Nonomuraea dietziae TaxID=65515 RepID=UPI0033FD388E
MEIRPEDAPSEALTRDEYREYMRQRGVVDCTETGALGIEGFLELAEAVGWLEKRPNIVLRNEEAAPGACLCCHL